MFFDPAARRCTNCPVHTARPGKCRKKHVTEFWFQCDPNMDFNSIHYSILKNPNRLNEDMMNMVDYWSAEYFWYSELMDMTGTIIMDNKFTPENYQEYDRDLY